MFLTFKQSKHLSTIIQNLTVPAVSSGPKEFNTLPTVSWVFLKPPDQSAPYQPLTTYQSITYHEARAPTNQPSSNKNYEHQKFHNQF